MARGIVVGLALALIVAACGDNVSSSRNTIVLLGDPATSPKAARDFLSCLRKEGVKVVSSRVGTAFDSARVAPGSRQLASFFWLHDNPTKAARTIAHTCAAVSA